MKEYGKIWLLSMGLLFLDQISKYFFYDQKLFADHLFFYPVFNTWVSRSVQLPIIVAILIATLALGVFVVAYKKRYFSVIVFSLLLAGTLWNLIDRIALSWVRDFLMIGYRFPVFNVADIYLTIGVAIFVILQLFAWNDEAKS